MRRVTLGSSSITQREIDAVTEVLKRNYISPGPIVEEVEKLTAAGHGLKHGLCLNSGQSAIEVGLRALNDKYGILTRKLMEIANGTKSYLRSSSCPIVAVPATTYISTLAAVALVDFEMVLVDVNIDGNMSADALKRVLDYQISIEEPVDIVVPVHLYGKACDECLKQVCLDPQYNLLILEDNCESMFSVGTGWGHICVSSFYSNHLLSAGGGGIIMTNDDELDMICWKLVNHGRTERFSNDDIYRIAEKFKFNDWGFSLKWNDVSAAIAKTQIERKNELYGARQRNARILSDELKVWADNGYLILPDHNNHNFMMYPIVLERNININQFIKCLNDHQIEVRRLMPVTNQDVVKEYFRMRNITDLDKRFPIAHLINERGLYVGTHPELSRDDMLYLANVIKWAISNA